VKKYWWLILSITVIGLAVLFWPKGWHNPFVGMGDREELTLEKYDFDNLKKRGGRASEIKIIGIAEGVEGRKKSEDKFKTQIFTFESEGKIISGTVNIPNPEMSSLKKAIVLIRGYAELEGYYSGSGTWKVAEILANEGYATFSIDFLGYGQSEKESTDMLEARFVKVANVMDLIESIKSIPWIDKENIGIWAHSNGGQIALSVLETTGGNYPTVLWAPMTQTFPESVLSTIDEGSPVKGVIEDFLKKYDSRRYAFENYYEWLDSPVLIQQGTADEWCQVAWQQKVVDDLKKLGKGAELTIYPNNDHNLSKSWDEAVKKDVKFYRNNLDE
jgi:alpha-beta hydrolase superfamily lysophospholipase